MREKIADEVTGAVRDRLGMGYTVERREIVKNNDTKFLVVSISGSGECVAQVVYIDRILDQVEDGDIDIQDAAREVISIYMDHSREEPLELVKHLDKDIILQNVMFQMVSREKNAQRIIDMPYIEFLDLAVICRVVREGGDGSLYSIEVTHRLCEVYDIDDRQLFHSARSNMIMAGFQVRTMADILEGIDGVPAGVSDIVPPLWVLTTKANRYGASVMLFNDEFNTLADKYDSDLYVIPSSIHEVLAVPIGDLDLDELRYMVACVNACEVPEEDRLSDSVYRYSRRENRLVIA